MTQGVQTRPPPGVGTPRAVSSRAIAAWLTSPPARTASISNANRWAALCAAWERAWAALAASGPPMGRQPLSPPSTAPRALAAAKAALVLALINSLSFCAIAA
jgi:hypothetical protein